MVCESSLTKPLILLLCHLQIALEFLETGRVLGGSLDHILLCALYDLRKLLGRLGVMLEQVVLDQTSGCLTHPVEEGEVLELIWIKC